MLYTGDILACLGLAGMLWAHSQGWRPNPRHLLLASAGIVAIMVCLTPVGSSDTASYAAYGRIAALGGNPYTTNPLAVPRRPLARTPWPSATMWKAQPSVYGPFATVIQSFAASIGGANVATTIWVLMILNGDRVHRRRVAAAEDLRRPGAGDAVLDREPGPHPAAGQRRSPRHAGGGGGDLRDPGARRVSGMWGDVLVGVLIGLACGVKINAVLIGLGLAWPLLRRQRVAAHRPDRPWWPLVTLGAAATATTGWAR